jgi:homoserine kinase
VFAWFETRAEADAALAPMRAGFAAIGIESRGWVSPVDGPAAELLS